jgi:hypothetical protein
MKRIFTLLVVLVGALSANAENKISALPSTITAPGTYELTSGLICPVAGNAITINLPVPGTVFLNLKGFSISWNGAPSTPGTSAWPS